MSTRRKFFIALNVIAVCIASLSYAVHLFSKPQTPAVIPPAEMQLIAIPSLADMKPVGCAPSCVITSRAALGLTQ